MFLTPPYSSPCRPTEFLDALAVRSIINIKVLILCVSVSIALISTDWLLGFDKVGDAASTFEKFFKRIEKSTVHRSTLIGEQQKLRNPF